MCLPNQYLSRGQSPNRPIAQTPKLPNSLAGDKAYSSKAIRQYFTKLWINDVIPTRSNEKQNDDFDKQTYRSRNIVERAIGWIKVATRYEKIIDNYLAMVKIAICRMLLRWE